MEAYGLKPGGFRPSGTSFEATVSVDIIMHSYAHVRVGTVDYHLMRRARGDSSRVW